MAARGPAMAPGLPDDVTGPCAEELAAANRMLRARLAIEQRLAADAGSGLAAAVRACHELTAMPVALVDAQGRLICQAPADACLPPGQVLLARTSSADTSQSVTLVAAGPATGLPRRLLLAPVLRGSVTLGWLAVEERGATFDTRARVVVERGAVRLAAEFLVQQRVARVAADARDALTRQLARGSRGLQDLRASGEYLGVDVDARRVLVHVPGAPTQEPEGVERPGGGAEPQSDARLVAHVARSLGADVLHTRGSEGLLLLVEVEDEAVGTAAVAAVREAVREALEKSRPRGSVAGLSRASRASEFPAAYREAREVAQCLRRFRDGTGPSVLAVDDLGPARLFLANTDSAALRAYMHGVLGPLLSGGPGMADLLETVQAWLSAGRSIRATATRLGLHENTIRLRLARVSTTTGLDVADANDQLALQTGMLLLRLQGHPGLPSLDQSGDTDDGRITA